MRSNTAKKLHTTHSVAHKKAPAEVLAFNPASNLAKIAAESHAACGLSKNKPSCDYEAFLAQYGEGIASDFA